MANPMFNPRKNTSVCTGAGQKYYAMMAVGSPDYAEPYLCPMLRGVRQCGRKIEVLNEGTVGNTNLYDACRENGFAFQIEI